MVQVQTDVRALHPSVVSTLILSARTSDTSSIVSCCLALSQVMADVSAGFSSLFQDMRTELETLTREADTSIAAGCSNDMSLQELTKWVAMLQYELCCC